MVAAEPEAVLVDTEDCGSDEAAPSDASRGAIHGSPLVKPSRRKRGRGLRDMQCMDGKDINPEAWKSDAVLEAVSRLSTAEGALLTSCKPRPSKRRRLPQQANPGVATPPLLNGMAVA